MTAVVGILCKDGVVLGTDSSMTLVAGQYRTIEQSTEKLNLIKERIIIAGTGNMGHGQRFQSIIEKAWEGNSFEKTRLPVDICRDISRDTVLDYKQTESRRDCYGALMAVPVGRKPVLCEFSIDLFQPTLYTSDMWFCSMGITQPITDPFLALMREIYWPESQPTVREAGLAVTWALDHAIAVNPGGVNGPAQIAVLERGDKDFQARRMRQDELTEHRSWIQEAKNSLSEMLHTKSGFDAPRMQKKKMKTRTESSPFLVETLHGS